MLTDFYESSQKNFQVTITYNDSYPDITLDEVRLMIKDKKSDGDTSALLNETADVTSQGASGVAVFELSPTKTNISPGNYFYEIYWTLSTGEIFTLEAGQIQVLDRVPGVTNLFRITPEEVRNYLDEDALVLTDGILLSTPFIPMSEAYIDGILELNSASFSDLTAYKQTLIKGAEIAYCANLVMQKPPQSKNQAGPFIVDPAKAKDIAESIKLNKQHIDSVFETLQFITRPRAFCFTSVGGDDYSPTGASFKNVDFASSEVLNLSVWD